MKIISSRLKQSSGWAELLLVILVFVLIVGIRLFYLYTDVPESSYDESIYFTVAQDVANGDALYVKSWDHKGPLLYLLFVPVLKLFGDDVVALRYLGLFYLLVSMFFVYLSSRLILRGPARAVPPFVYGILFCSRTLQGLSVTGELLMLLPATAAVYVFFKYLRDNKYPFLMPFLCGFLSSLAVFIKLNVLFSVIILPLAAMVRGRSKEVEAASWRRVTEAAGYIFGACLLSAAVAVYFLRHGLFGEFIWSTFIFNYHYCAGIGFAEAAAYFRAFFEKAVPGNYFLVVPVFLLGMALLPGRLLDKEERRVWGLFIAMFFFSLLGLVSLKFAYPHYYLQMVLPVSFLAGLFVCRIDIPERRMTLILLGLLCACLLFAYTPSRLGLALKRRAFFARDDLHAVASYIKENTSPRETIFVLGKSPLVYFYSGRRAPTRIFLSHQYEGRFYGPIKFRYSPMQALEVNRPKYFVYLWDPEIPAILQQFMLENYFFVGAIGKYEVHKLNPIAAPKR